MVSCRAPGPANRADKKVNITTLIMISQHIQSPGTYLTPEAYSKHCQIFKMMGCIEKPDIEQFIQAFSDIFKVIQQYSAMCRHIEGN